MPFEHRIAILEACRYVDAVFPERHWEQKREDILRKEADIFAMGDDWTGKFDDLGDICQVVYLPRTADVSSTEIRQLVKVFKGEQVQALKNSAEQLMKNISLL